MNLYLENPNKFIHLKYIRDNNQIQQIVGCKINIKKLVVFLYTRNEQLKNEIKKTIPFIIAFKRIICLKKI